MAVQAASAREMTLEEFGLRYAGKRYEYVDGRAVPMGPEIVGPDGEVTVMPTKPEHGELALEIGAILRNFVRPRKLGQVYGAETGFVMRQDTQDIRAADAAFISHERVQAVKRGEWLPFPPDLAVEVISEYDRTSDTRRKAQDYMENGTRLLWVVYPDSKMIDVYRPGQPIVTLGMGDMLDGGDVLPGFAVAIKEIFAPLEALGE